MQQALDLLATPWDSGPFRTRTRGLLFGAMYEDPAIELEAFTACKRVFCIASAGCTARALSAGGHEVTAVDLNPQQIIYARARAAGSPMREGAVDRLLSRARALFPLVGWGEDRRREFLSMSHPCDQIRYWHRNLNTERCCSAMDTILSGWLLRLVYRKPFVACLPRHFGSVIRVRLERTWRNHPNNTNPYARRFLLGEIPTLEERMASPIRFVCEDAATYLERCAPTSFDAFSLSNIADGAPAAYLERLCRAIERAGAPGAVIVTRSLGEPKRAIFENLAARDRSLLWGAVHVTYAANLCSTF